ncbi:unnamed protein product [Calypogeia fissa]
MNRQQIGAVLNQHQDGTYNLTWHKRGVPIVRNTSLQEVQREFPEYCQAILECHEALNPAILVEQLQMCSAYSYVDRVMKRKRFQVYQHLAWACGYGERTQFPAAVEAAIKATWQEEGEDFVGFWVN